MTRRLNVLVAERVMVWHREFDEEGNEQRWYDEWGEPYVPWFDELRLIMNYDEPMRHIPFSTSIGAAWQVVERVRDKAYRIESIDRYVRGENDIVFRLVSGPWGSRCTVVASLDNYGERYATVIGTADAKTMSLAICLAILRAVGVSEDEIQASMEVDE